MYICSIHKGTSSEFAAATSPLQLRPLSLSLSLSDPCCTQGHMMMTSQAVLTINFHISSSEATAEVASPNAEAVDTCIRQHTSAYVSIRQLRSLARTLRPLTPAYVSIRQHTSAYVSIRQLRSLARTLRPLTPAYVSVRQHTSAYATREERRKELPATISIRQRTSAYVSIRQHSSAFATREERRKELPATISARLPCKQSLCVTTMYEAYIVVQCKDTHTHTHTHRERERTHV
jgi:hypothetical protein